MKLYKHPKLAIPHFQDTTTVNIDVGDKQAVVIILLKQPNKWNKPNEF